MISRIKANAVAVMIESPKTRARILSAMQQVKRPSAILARREWGARTQETGHEEQSPFQTNVSSHTWRRRKSAVPGVPIGPEADEFSRCAAGFPAKLSRLAIPASDNVNLPSWPQAFQVGPPQLGQSTDPS